MLVLAGTLMVSVCIAFAADQERTQQQTQTRMQEQIEQSGEIRDVSLII
jgi:hypothetical protein